MPVRPLQFKAALVESQVFLDNGTCPIHPPHFLTDVVDNFFGIALGLDNQPLPLQPLKSCRSPILMQLQVTKHG